MSDTLADLVTFARLEVAANDIEPWAEVIRAMRLHGRLDDEAALWVLKLYNAYDDIGSALRVYGEWSGPREWLLAEDRRTAAGYPCSRERRNLRGGKVLRHLDSYAAHLGGLTQRHWIGQVMDAHPWADAFGNFAALMPQLRRVWGVGRQTAFEWAEFIAKILDLPIETPDALLWESSGPRESIERLYDGNGQVTSGWLNDRAAQCRRMLQAEGVFLSWWDFETIICDFNVMRKGRYYPGQHLAMIREEIESLPDPYRDWLEAAWVEVVPEPWSRTPAGVHKEMARTYRDTGTVPTPDMVLEARNA